MKIIITFTFCCNNLSKSQFMALEKPGKLGNFFLLLCGHPDLVDQLIGHIFGAVASFVTITYSCSFFDS